MAIFNTLLRLTFRQVATIRRVIIIAVLVAIPIAGAVLIVYFDFRGETAEIIINFALFSTVLPIVALVVASPAFSDEIEDRTLPILALTPIPRWQIVLPKLVAAFVIAVVPLSVATFVSAGIAADVNPFTSAIAATVGVTFGCICYSSLFLFLGTITGRSIIVGLIYILAWENVFLNLLPTLSYTSISQWSVSIASQIEPYILALDSDGTPDATGIPSVVYSVIAGAVIVIGCTIASVRRLRTMDVN